MRVRARRAIAALLVALALAVMVPAAFGHGLGGRGNGVGGSPLGCVDGNGQAANHNPNCP
jgi:hypothetical protein